MKRRKQFNPFDLLNSAVESFVGSQPHAFLGVDETKPRRMDYGAIDNPRINAPADSTDGFIKYCGNYTATKQPIAIALGPAAGAIVRFEFDRSFSYFVCQPGDGPAAVGGPLVVWRGLLNGSPVMDFFPVGQPISTLNSSINAASLRRNGSTINHGFLPEILFDKVEVVLTQQFTTPEANFVPLQFVFFPWVIKRPFHPLMLSGPTI